MMDPKKKLAELQKGLLAIQKKAKAEGRDFTDDEMSEIETKSAEAIELKGKIERSAKADEIFERIAGASITSLRWTPVASRARSRSVSTSSSRSAIVR